MRIALVLFAQLERPRPPEADEPVVAGSFALFVLESEAGRR